MRNVLVKMNNPTPTFLMEVRTVIDPYVMRKKPRTAKWKANDMRLLKEKIYAAHSYYFRPQEDEENGVNGAAGAAVPAPTAPPGGFGGTCDGVTK